MTLPVKVFFIGNRTHVYDFLKTESTVHLQLSMAAENSFLARSWTSSHSVEKHHIFSLKDRQKVFSLIQNTDFDVLVSNGCPFLLPVSLLRRPHQIFINIHPTPLPFLKGKTPINGYILHHMNEFGATVHMMDEGIDTGPIIYQLKKPLTPDIDLGLLYHLAFELEGVAFQQAWLQFLKNQRTFRPIPQDSHLGSTFNRTPQDQHIDPSLETSEAIHLKIRSFGVASQGVFCKIEDKSYQIWESEIIQNSYVLEKFRHVQSGKIALFYQDFFLLRTKDGLLKIKRYRQTQEGR